MMSQVIIQDTQISSIGAVRPYLRVLDEVAQLPPELAVREVASALTRLVREPAFRLADLLHGTTAPAKPLLAAGDAGQSLVKTTPDPYVAARHEGGADSYALQVFVWPAGSSSYIHDHSCWGAIVSATGVLHEERYVRVDDGSVPNQAHLKKAWHRMWTLPDGASTLMPYDGGIHRVSNPSAHDIVSVHVYGPSGPVDGRDYNPMHDYVCDRLYGD